MRGKYFVEEGPGLNLCFVLKNNKSNSCFIGNFIYKERGFLASRQYCSVALKARYVQQLNFTTAEVLSIKCEILWFHKLNTAWNKRFCFVQKANTEICRWETELSGSKKKNHRENIQFRGKGKCMKKFGATCYNAFLT